MVLMCYLNNSDYFLQFCMFSTIHISVGKQGTLRKFHTLVHTLNLAKRISFLEDDNPGTSLDFHAAIFDWGKIACVEMN